MVHTIDNVQACYLIIHYRYYYDAVQLHVSFPYTEQQLTIIATEHFPNGSTVSPAHLSCSVEPRDAVSHYRWLYNGEVIVNDTTPANGELVMVPFLNHTGSVIESFTDINNRTNLFITKLSYEDAGKYTCEFTSNEGQNFSATIHVQLTCKWIIT